MNGRLRVDDLKKVQRDADRLDKKRVDFGVEVEKIIREQEAIKEASEKGIERLNGQMEALQKRLSQYMTDSSNKKAKPFDENYYTQKDRYTNMLAERAALERAWVMATESVTAAKLHRIPGEFDRSTW